MTTLPQTAPQPIRRLLYDATSTLYTGYKTGIQRVVLSLEEPLRALCEAKNIHFQTVYFDGTRYALCTPEFRRKIWMRRRLINALSKPLALIAPYASFFMHQARKYKRRLKRNHKEKLHQLLKTSLISKFFFLLSGLLLLNLKVAGFFIRLFQRLIRKISFHYLRPRDYWTPERGDILLLADATWNFEPWPFIEDAKKSGAQVHAIVYDLLPIKYPHFFSDILVHAFQHWWRSCDEYVDAFYCISKAVQQDVETRLTRESPNRPATFVFPLGVDFSPKTAQQSASSAEIALLDIERPLDSSVVFLTVGTIEPRKNHGYILDAFDRAWKTDLSRILVIVGRRGWFCKEIAVRIRKHPLYNKNLFWFDDCNDATLEQLYGLADGLIAASIDEGYGLPLIEGAARGVPALASDIPVFHEVAVAGTRFFDLEDPASLAAHIAATEKAPFPKQPLAQSPFPSWEDSAKSVYHHLFLASYGVA